MVYRMKINMLKPNNILVKPMARMLPWSAEVIDERRPCQRSGIKNGRTPSNTSIKPKALIISSSTHGSLLNTAHRHHHLVTPSAKTTTRAKDAM
tara:strand:- start:330 stop:611 length:282 start_codon:yes stop_codon:yes gene_type:complete